MPLMPRRVSSLAAAGPLALIAALALAGCTKDNPNACQTDDQRPECNPDARELDAPTCPSPPDHCPIETPVCNEGTGVCGDCTIDDDCTGFAPNTTCHVPSGACGQCTPTSGMDTDGQSAQCAAAGMPICDASDRTCRACQENSECDSLVCDKAAGSCVPIANVVYMDPGSTVAGNGACGAAPTPVTMTCKTLETAVDKVTATRKYIRMAPGSYRVSDMAAGFKINKTVIILGDGATLQRTDAGSILEVVNNGKVQVEGLTVSGNIANMASIGADCTGSGELTLFRTRLTANQGTGMSGVGVRAMDNCKLVIDRSTIDHNTNGGILVTFGLAMGTVSIANNFVVDNGSVASTFGGISVTTSNSATPPPRVEFNTIVNNVSAAGEVDGFACSNANAVMRNNLITGTAGKARVGGSCTHRNTLVSPTCDSAPVGLLACGMNGNVLVDAAMAPMLHFIQLTAPANYHLGPDSIAKGKADNVALVPGVTDHDVDGDARTVGGMLEPGADEIP